MRVQEAVTRPHPTRRLGPAPARMVPAAVNPTAQPVEIDTQSPRKFPWIAKRFAIWCFGTVLSATAFHLTGFVLLGVIAIVFPIGYWAKISIEARRIFGAGDANSSKQLMTNALKPYTFGNLEYFRRRRASRGF